MTEREEWALMLDSAAARIVELTARRNAVWERNWLLSYHAALEGAPNLLTRIRRDAEHGTR